MGNVVVVDFSTAINYNWVNFYQLLQLRLKLYLNVLSILGGRGGDKIKHFIDIFSQHSAWGQICLYNFTTSLLIQERHMTCVFIKALQGEANINSWNQCTAPNVLHVGFMKCFSSLLMSHHGDVASYALLFLQFLRASARACSAMSALAFSQLYPINPILIT